MKLMIKGCSEALTNDLCDILDEVAVTVNPKGDTLLIADNSIEWVEIQFSYITLYFKEKKYFNSGIRSYGIKRSQLKSFEVIE